mmetsp:Transcript_15957/g.46541  ORF Transcript_15957/g.46541 Transcript_15957/m.46541 type:complete len:203 (-) Transcript_15957:251-859(-)
MPDHFRELGLERSATEEQIKEKYRKLALKHHPDVNPGCEASETKFKDLTIAYNAAIGEAKMRGVRSSRLDMRQAAQARHQARSGSSAYSRGGHFDRRTYGDASEHVNMNEWNQAHYGGNNRYDYSGTRRWNVGQSERAWEDIAARRYRASQQQNASRYAAERARWRNPPRYAVRKPPALILVAMQVTAVTGIWAWVASTWMQ